MKHLKFSTLILLGLVLVLGFNVYATTDTAPGSLTTTPDFTNVTRGLYFDGNDFYFLLDTGIPATNYMYNMEGDRFYFGDDGKMVKNELVEYDNEKYFFDENGAMMKNRWATEEIVDPYDKSIEKTSYYFGPTGRAYRAADGEGVLVKLIDGERFGFNVDGERLSGYVNAAGDELDENDTFAYAECMYYFDPFEEDSAAVGWHQYNGLKDTDVYNDDDEMYLYFDEKTCRKVCSNSTDKYARRTIDGERYMFNQDGVRFFKWYGSVASSSSPKYFSDDYDGFLAKGWFMAVPSETSVRQKNIERHASEEDMWYYADSQGRVLRSCIKKIGAYTYCFDEDGVMLYDCMVVVKDGLYQRAYECEDLKRNDVLLSKVDGGLLEDGEKWLYFTLPEDENLIGTMCKLNSTLKIDLIDETIEFCANSKGGYGQKDPAATLERNGKIFQNGVLLQPLNDYKYGIVQRSKDTDSNSEYDPNAYYYAVVDSKGAIQTKYGAYKDNNNNYVLCRNNGEFVGVYNVQCKYSAGSGQWSYKPDKTWIVGFPPQQYEVSNQSSYYINFENYNGIAEEYAAKYRFN